MVKLKNKIEVHRTKEGTIFELVFLALAIILWGYVFWLVNHLPDQIPTHFDALGKADKYGSPTALIYPVLITSVVGLCVMAGAYFPSTWNMPFKLKTPNQWAHAIRLMRITSILVLLLGAAIVFSMSMSISSPNGLPIIIYSVVMLAIGIGYALYIYKIR